MKHRPSLVVSALSLAAASTWAADLPLLGSTSRGHHTGHQLVSESYRPQHVAAGDLDGDGDPDLVVAQLGNFIDPKVTVLLNQGDGSYGPPVNYPALGQTMEVVVGDFDGDDDLDAAFAQSDQGIDGSSVLVYANAGDGTFLPHATHAVGVGPTGLAAADVDGDGDLDLVTANWRWGEEDVTVLYNDGSGGFPVRVDYPIPGLQPLKVAAGDLTGDGAPELVVSLRDGSPAFAVLTNDGSGAFGAPTTYSAGATFVHDADVAVADVDLDGDGDVLYGNSGAGVALLRNPGSGALGPAESFSVGSSFGALYDVHVADVTGDGWPDVLGTAQSSAYGYVVLPSDGVGGFGAPLRYRSGEYARSITATDADGDGDLDAIVANAASLTITVHANDGGGFSLPPVYPTSGFTEELAAGDVDQDGDLDLVSSETSRFRVLENQGDGTFVVSDHPSSGGKDRPKLRDLNGDDYPDMIFLGTGLGVALNDGAGSFHPITSFSLGGGSDDVETLDFDGDGDLDAVVTGSNGGNGFHALANDGSGTFGAPTFFGTFTIPGTDRVATGDYDGDGNADVLTGQADSLGCWLGDGAGGFASPIVSSLGSGGTVHMTSADFDGDGLLDAAGATWGSSFAGENLTVVFGNGDGTFAAPVTYYGMFSLTLGGVAGLAHGDVDGDGDLDLVGGCYAADDVALFLNNGDRTFAPERRYGVDGHVRWVVTGDFDGDGLSDVAADLGSSPPLGGGVTVLLGSIADPFTDLGFGIAGVAGVPVLSGLGTPADSAPVLVDLANARPSAFSVLVFGSERIDAPLFGGTLVPAPQSMAFFTTHVAGGFAFVTTWPSGLPVGSGFYAQAWTIDPAAIQGVAASNVLLAVQQP